LHGAPESDPPVLAFVSTGGGIGVVDILSM
jgi:hypothetical protein